MRRARLAVDGLSAGRRKLGKDDVHYLVSVLRLRPGESFTAFDPKARREAPCVLGLEGKKTYVATVGELGPVAPQPRTIEWIHGLAKGGKNDAIVRDLTELGATSIVFAICARSVKRSEKAQRWEKIANEASRQCGRIDAPAVTVIPLARALESTCAKRICFYEDADEPLDPSELAGTQSLSILVGPEGGFEKEEVNAAVRAGFEVRSLGDRILRTETVPAAVLGAVLVLGGRTG